MTEAAFRATYSDWKLIRSRKVVQIVMEVPVELAGQAYDVLGGMPNPASETWCAIARLVPGAEPVNEPASATPAGQTGKGNPAQEPHPPMDTGRDRRVRTEAQRAGYLCTLPSFQKYLVERCLALEESKDEAADAIRLHCEIKSRSEIDTNQYALERWRMMTADFDLWQRGM